ncbi:TPA: hypothetical protein QH074_004308 [Enterobacter hormaechei subsp. steigerwaltii]|nr:hypothetical protein [Enterobacter hormaechei subsp. steigerwaltii]
MSRRPHTPAVLRTVDALTAGRSIRSQMQFVTTTGEPLRIVNPGSPACVLISAQTWEAIRTALNITGGYAVASAPIEN